MIYADMHNHALFGVDDGAKTEEMMLAMVDASYQDGVRFLCLTPHFHPRGFGDNRNAVLSAYEKLCQKAIERWPGLKLGLGNELRYERGCISWIRDSMCKTMNETNYVLVDFNEAENAEHIHQALGRLLNAGYTPVLAHAERYNKLRERDVRKFKENGVLIQVDTQSLFRNFGFSVQRRCKRLLKSELVDFAGSDAHDLTNRIPEMSRFYETVKKFCSVEYATALCSKNAETIFFAGANIEKDRR